MKKYENFCNALNNLKDIFNYEEPYNNVITGGIVGLYEICFEQSWKAMKEILENLNKELLTYLNEQVYKETEQVGQNLNTFTVLDLVKSDKLSNMLIADLLKGEYSVIGSNIKDSGGENVYRLAIDINKDGKLQDTEEIMLSTGRGFYGKEGNLGTVTIEGTEITWQGVTASTR